METYQTENQQLSEAEISRKMEDEQLRLQRQFHDIQTDRMLRTLGVHPKFRRQNILLSTLKKEYINLIKDLKIARSGAHKKKDKKMKYTLKKSLLYMMKMDTEFENGLNLMKELDGLILRHIKNFLRYRSLHTANATQLNERRLQSEQRLLYMENNLETAEKKYNLVQNENKKLREEIEHMLKDRAIFNAAWDKMLASLKKGKKFLLDLYESSTVAYDQRDEWCMKLKSLQEKGKMDQMMQIHEMRDLQKTYDHEAAMFEFLATKGIKRINKNFDKKEQQKKRMQEELLFQELNVNLKIIEEINEYTNETDPGKIVEMFEKIEQDIFSIYLLLTEKCAENEVLSRDIKRIRQDLEDRRDWNESAENKRVQSLNKLKTRITVQQMRNDVLKIEFDYMIQLLNKSMKEISEMFNDLECSLEPFSNLLGDRQPSLNVINLTLQLIIEKAKEKIEVVYYNERSQKKKDHTKTTESRLKKFTVHLETKSIFKPIPIKFLVPADPCPSCTETRWVSRVIEKPEVPMDMKMIKEALNELCSDPAYLRSDRIHTLADCRLPHSRMILGRRYN